MTASPDPRDDRDRDQDRVEKLRRKVAQTDPGPVRRFWKWLGRVLKP